MSNADPAVATCPRCPFLGTLQWAVESESLRATEFPVASKKIQLPSRRRAEAASLAFVAALATGVASAPAQAPTVPASPGAVSVGHQPGLVLAARDARHRVRFITRTPNFYLDADESPHPALAASFEAEWTGFLLVLRTADYTFDRAGAQVFIDGKPIGDEPIRIESGRRPVRIAYRRADGPARLRIRWKAAYFDWEPIPPDRWSHDPGAGPTRQDFLIEQGRRLAEDYGCVNCHRTESKSLRGRPGHDLTGIASRVATPWLAHWIEDPRAFRPRSPMPRQLTPEQSRDAAAYFASLAQGGDFEFQRMSKEAGPFHGQQLFATLGCAACHENPESDPAQALDGLGSKMSVAALKAYLLDPARFDPAGRMPSSALTDKEAYNLATLLTRSRNPVFEQPTEKGDANRGRSVIRFAGCLACHALDGEAAASNEHAAPELSRLSPDKGCLAEDPTGVPIYSLEDDQRRALNAFVAAYHEHPDISPSPVYDLPRRMRQLGCVTCHQVDHIGPTAPVAETAPTLSEAGAKLTPSWIASTLDGSADNHHRRQLRMPRYDAAVSEPFVAALAKASGLAPDTASDTGPTETAFSTTAARGVGFLGTNASRDGMGCVGCHGFQGHDPLGEDGPDLTHAGRRLRSDWFRRWMRDPARIVSGTSMPNYFTSTARAETEQTIGALWAALSHGEGIPLPEGLAGGPPEDRESLLVPKDDPIVVRWYMPEATPAAIAVGLPGGVSYCFDAGESRLRYAWLGGFLDTTGTLTEKRDPATQRTRTPDLIGDIFYRTVEHPLRVGSPERLPATRFRGYRLVDGHPEFHYEIGGVEVHERITATDKKDGIQREFRLPQVDQPTWLLLEEDEAVTITSSIENAIDGRLTIPVGRDVRFVVTAKRRPQ